MSGISDLSGKFRIAGTRKQRPETRKIIRRPRQTLACHRCQTSKLRCDKARPCGSCVREDGGLSCLYDGQTQPNINSATEDRLARLETIVSQLLYSSASEALQSSHAPPKSPDNGLRTSGGDQVGVLKEQYPTVVEEIMNNIHQLRLELQNTLEMPDSEAPATHGRILDDECIFGLPTSYSQHAILSQYMPAEKEADQLLATYFRGDTFIQPFIHTQNFQRQYQAFRKDGFLTASTLWLSTLFSIFSISAMVPGAAFPEADAQTRSHMFQIAAGQLLVLGKYHKTQRDAPEALLLYAHCKALKSLGPSHECGTIISIDVRHAYQLGYHCDPDVFGKFTVFEGEMRRRFWACCKQVDTMVSFQLGLSSNIILEHCDTKSPSNLLDSDFNSNTKVLPCPRPDTEATPILWFIVKDKLMPVFAKACRASLSLRNMTEADLMDLDTEVKQAHSSIPVVLRWRPLEISTTDPPFLIMCRLFLELLYLKSLCILHRRYAERGNPYSVCQCIQAASNIIRSVADVHCELRPNGRLQDVRWMLTGIVMTDSHLGAIMLCLYINMRLRGIISEAAVSNVTTEEVLELLAEARLICIERASSSTDAMKIARAIQLTLASANCITTESTRALPEAIGEVDEEPIFDAYTGQDPYLESHVIFSELDMFNFLSDTWTNHDTFWSSTQNHSESG